MKPGVINHRAGHVRVVKDIVLDPGKNIVTEEQLELMKDDEHTSKLFDIGTLELVDLEEVKPKPPEAAQRNQGGGKPADGAGGSKKSSSGGGKQNQQGQQRNQGGGKPADGAGGTDKDNPSGTDTGSAPAQTPPG